MKDKKTLFKFISRTGYASKLVAYCMLGALVIMSALSWFQQDHPTKRDVFQELAQQPFGSIMIWLIIAGFVCYAIWRWAQAFLNPEESSGDWKGIIRRVFYAISGVIYLSGAYLAYRVVSADSSGGSTDNKERWTRLLMEYNWGVWVVGAIGLTVMVFAVIQFKNAWKQDFMDKFDCDNMSDSEQHTCKTAGRFGFLARGIVYVIVGGFFVRSAITHDPDKVIGLQQAFQTIVEQPFGQILLTITGLCLFLFGVFCGFEARYRAVE